MQQWKRLWLGLIFLAITVATQAETRFVTDRLLLGVHQNPSEASLLVASLPSGTEVKVLEQDGDFSRIKTANGTEGWIYTQYLVQQKPAAALLDASERQLRKLGEELKAVKIERDKREREAQIRRDELANATSTVKELKKKLESKQPTPAKQDNSAGAAQLKAAEGQVQQLQARVEELTRQQAEATERVEPTVDGVSPHQLAEDNRQLRARIEVALANLSGKDVPTPEELASLHPKFPAWFWGLIVTVLLVGFIAGMLFFDRQNRRRHGGFRL